MIPPSGRLLPAANLWAEAVRSLRSQYRSRVARAVTLYIESVTSV